MKKDAATLVDEFADSVIKQAQAIHSGTTKEVRYYGNKLTPIAKRLVHMGDSGIRQFATLLRHLLRSIKVTAAVYLFPYLPSEVLATLNEIAEGDDFHAMCAQLRIDEWNEHPEHYDESNWV